MLDKVNKRQHGKLQPGKDTTEESSFLAGFTVLNKIRNIV